MKVFVQSNMLIAQNFLTMRGSWQVVHYIAPIAQSDGVVPVPTAPMSTLEEGNYDDLEDKSR